MYPQVKAEKDKKIRELTDPDHAWDVATPEPASGGGGAEASAGDGELVEYRAVYDFDASNDDELGFRIGDVIMVRVNQEHEPGWLGELNIKLKKRTF